MAKNWYVFITWVKYENKVEKALRAKLESGELSSDVLTDIKIPVAEIKEKVIRVNKKTGQEKEVEVIKKELIYPGYVFLEIDFPEVGWKDICSIIRRVKGGSGFAGVDPNTRPHPMRIDEVRTMLQNAGELRSEKNIKIKQDYSIGDHVKVKEGPFDGFEGSVEEIYADKNKLKVLLKVFDRLTPVDIDVSQVDKLVK